VLDFRSVQCRVAGCSSLGSNGWTERSVDATYATVIEVGAAPRGYLMAQVACNDHTFFILYRSLRRGDVWVTIGIKQKSTYPQTMLSPRL
jgi:hypothetical protein